MDAFWLRGDDPLGQTVVASEGPRATGRRPRILCNLDRPVLGACRGLSHPAPGHLGVGENHGRYRPRLEDHRLTGDYLDDGTPLMRSLVCQHGFAHHIPDGKDRWFMRPACGIHPHKTLLVQFDLGVLETQVARVRPASDGHQNLIDAHTLCRRVLAVEGELQTVLQFFQPRYRSLDALHAFVQDTHQVGVGAWKMLRHHFDHGDPGAERRVHRSQFEPDVTASDDQERRGYLVEIERAGRVQDSRRADVQRRYNGR